MNTEKRIRIGKYAQLEKGIIKCWINRWKHVHDTCQSSTYTWNINEEKNYWKGFEILTLVCTKKIAGKYYKWTCRKYWKNIVSWERYKTHAPTLDILSWNSVLEGTDGWKSAPIAIVSISEIEVCSNRTWAKSALFVIGGCSRISQLLIEP